jgi:hypothetical protein
MKPAASLPSGRPLPLQTGISNCCPSLGQAYVAKRLAAGDTKTEAIRALRRRLSDEVFRRLQADEAANPLASDRPTQSLSKQLLTTHNLLKSIKT